jgi:O-antigen/teichoic acid export membrane protein
MIPVLRSVYEKGFFHLLSANIFHQFLGFGILLVVAKFLTPAELGDIRILQAYIAVFTVFAVFGISTAVLKTCAEQRPESEREGILKTGLRRAVLTTVLALSILAVLALGGVITSTQHLASWLMVYALVIPFSVVTEILFAYLQALKKIKQLARVNALFRLQAFIIIILATYFWGFQGFIFAAIAGYILGLIPTLHTTGTTFIRRAPYTVSVVFKQLALFSVLSSGISIIGKFGDMFLLDHLTVDRELIGYYALASLFMYGAIQVTATVQSISTPYFSERSKELAWLKEKVGSIQLRVGLLSIGVSGGIILLAYLLIRLFYGEAYITTLDFLPILLLKYVFWSWYAVKAVALLGLGNMKYNFIVVSVVTPLSILSSYLLFRVYGVPGIAAGQVIGSVAGLLLTGILYRRAIVLREAETRHGAV